MKILDIIKKLLKIDDVVPDENVLMYITANEALPSPLTPEEEVTVMNELREGKQSAKNTLIERNLRLVVYIARKFDNTGVDVEDLISVGTIGLIKAVNSFDPDKTCHVCFALYRKRDTYVS